MTGGTATSGRPRPRNSSSKSKRRPGRCRSNQRCQPPRSDESATENTMTTAATSNKAVVLEAFDLLFNRRDYDAAEGFWSESYIQHSALIAPGREALFQRVRSLPSLRYENQFTVASVDHVMLYGRCSGITPAALVTANVLRVQDGRLAEHWDI